MSEQTEAEVKKLLEKLQDAQPMSAGFIDAMREIRQQMKNDDFRHAFKEALPEHTNPEKPNILGRIVKEAEPVKEKVQGAFGPKLVQKDPQPDELITMLASDESRNIAIELDHMRNDPDYTPKPELAQQVYEEASNGALTDEEMKITRYIQQMGGGAEDYTGSTNLGSGMTNAQGEPDLGEIQGTMNCTRVDAMVEATDEAKNSLDHSRDNIYTAEEAAKLSQEQDQKYSTPFDVKPPSPYDND